MSRLYVIIIVIVISFSFSAIKLEKSDNMRLLRFSSGILQHVKGDPESGVRSYLYSIRYKLGLENANTFPLDFYKEGKKSRVWGY